MQEAFPKLRLRKKKKGPANAILAKPFTNDFAISYLVRAAKCWESPHSSKPMLSPMDSILRLRQLMH
jgi:hypothetical protein